MSKVRHIKIPARAAALDNIEQSGGIGSGSQEERLNGASNLDLDISEASSTQEPPTIDGSERLSGLSGTRGRKLMLLGSALVLVMVFSIAVWLFGARASAITTTIRNAGEQAGTSYPIMSAG